MRFIIAALLLILVLSIDSARTMLFALGHYAYWAGITVFVAAAILFGVYLVVRGGYLLSRYLWLQVVRYLT